MQTLALPCLLFLIAWFLINIVLTYISGWYRFSKIFKVKEKPNGDTFLFASGSVARQGFFPVYSRFCLYVIINNDGIYLAYIFPFSVMTPAFFVPWLEIESINVDHFLFFERSTLKIRNNMPTISLSGRTGSTAKLCYEAWKKNPIQASQS